MIRGPTGDERLDANFGWLRHVIWKCQASDPPSIEDLTFKFDYRNHFRPKGTLSAIEAMVENIDKDVAAVMALGAKIKKQQAELNQ